MGKVSSDLFISFSFKSCLFLSELQKLLKQIRRIREKRRILVIFRDFRNTFTKKLNSNDIYKEKKLIF